MLYFDVLKQSFFWLNHEITCWILVPFLSETVEASWCYFFENWFMKFKCPNLLKPLKFIIQQNYRSFYTSEPSTLAHFNMRHPVFCHTSYMLIKFQKRKCWKNFPTFWKQLFCYFEWKWHIILSMKPKCNIWLVVWFPIFYTFCSKRKHTSKRRTKHTKKISVAACMIVA